MIIFGISGSERAGKALTARCGHCGETALVSVRRYRYFHLFWLPVIPLGSTDLVACTHCKQILDKTDMDDALNERASQGNRYTARPRWHFIGTTLAAGLIVFNIQADAEHEKAAQQAAAQPQIGDVWIVDVKDTWADEAYKYRYSAGRIVAVHGDEVEIAMSDWSYLVSGGAMDDALKAVVEQQEDYFVSPVSVPAEQLIALQASEDFRLLRND